MLLVANLKDSKSYNGGTVYPVHALETSGLLRRAEPLLTPEQLVSRFLKGIPLMFRNGDVFTAEELKDRINLAINSAELILGRNITLEQFNEKAPFDYNLYRQFIHIHAEHGPIVSIQELAIVSSDNQNIFTVPPEWIEAANFSKGLINVIPLLAAFGSNQVAGSPVGPSTPGQFAAGGIAFLSTLGPGSSVPAYWGIKYTAGLTSKEGKYPIPVNELIGCIAAVDILSEIAATFFFTSQALSQDGISQSSSGPGPMVFQLRIQELMLKRDELTRKLKGLFGSKYFVSNI